MKKVVKTFRLRVALPVCAHETAIHEAGKILSVDGFTILLLQNGSFIVKYGFNLPDEFTGAEISRDRFKTANHAVAA